MEANFIRKVCMDEINAENQNELVNAVFGMKNYLPDDPSPKDLVPFLYNRMRTKRLRKKFLDHHSRYWDLLPKFLYGEYIGKRLAKPAAEYMKAVMNREGFARRLFKIDTIQENVTNET